MRHPGERRQFSEDPIGDPCRLPAGHVSASTAAHARPPRLRPRRPRAQGAPARLARATTGYEPVDHGPFVYDALDDYPVFCLRAAEAVVADEPRADSLGVVIGGSGNGEQIAANKVTGIRAALVWSDETAVLARQHNDANVISVGGRMHTRRGHDPLRRGLPRRRRSPARSGTCAGSAMLADYEKTGNLPPLPESALGARPTRTRMPEGHTLHRLAADLTATFAGRPVRVSSPQGRFAADAALLDGASCSGRRVRGQAPVRRASRATGSSTSTSASTASSTCTGRGRGAAPGRPGPAAAGAGPSTAYADLRGATACDLVDAAASATRVLARLGPDPLRADADPEPRLGADPPQPARRSAAC